MEFDTGISGAILPPLITVPVKGRMTVVVLVGVAVGLRVGVAVIDGVGVGLRVGVAVTVAVAVAVAVGVGVGTGAKPIPSSFTFCGLWAPPSVKVSEPWNSPFDGGLNVTETVQLLPGDKIPGHTYGLKLKPRPVTAMFGAGILTPLLLVKATPCGGLVMPT
jgi:hypothetical protein